MAEQPRWPWHPGQAVEVRYDIILNDGAIWGGAWHAGVVNSVADRTGAVKVTFPDDSTDKLDLHEYGRMRARNAMPRSNDARFHRDSAALCAIYNVGRSGANAKAVGHAGSPWSEARYYGHRGIFTPAATPFLDRIQARECDRPILRESERLTWDWYSGPYKSYTRAASTHFDDVVCCAFDYNPEYSPDVLCNLQAYNPWRHLVDVYGGRGDTIRIPAHVHMGPPCTTYCHRNLDRFHRTWDHPVTEAGPNGEAAAADRGAQALTYYIRQSLDAGLHTTFSIENPDNCFWNLPCIRGMFEGECPPLTRRALSYCHYGFAARKDTVIASSPGLDYRAQRCDNSGACGGVHSDGTHHGKDSGITAQDTAVPLLLCATIIQAWRGHHGRRAWQGLTITEAKALRLAEQWERQPFVRRARRAQRRVLAAEAKRVAAACISCNAHAQGAKVGGAPVCAQCQACAMDAEWGQSQ